MYEFKTAHLPLVDKGRYLGLITEDDIMDFNHPDEPLSNYQRQLYHPMVRDTDHLYDVMKVAAGLESTLLPVVDADMQYVGLITVQSLVRWFAAMRGISEEGRVITIKLPGIKDYTLSDVARLVESNNAQILSTSLRNVPETGELQLTIKVNTTEIQHIIATLQRFEYDVEVHYRESESNEDVQDRYDALMNYLNI
jgi:CBS domain-containing protein